MIPRGRVGFRFKWLPPKTPREVSDRDEDEVALPGFYRGGGVNHEFRDGIIPVADIEPSFIRPVHLKSIAPTKMINGGGNILMST